MSFLNQQIFEEKRKENGVVGYRKTMVLLIDGCSFDRVNERII